MARYEPPFSSAQRSSTLKHAMPSSETGKCVDFPLPDGPATTTILGRSAIACLPALHVGWRVGAHVRWQRNQQVSVFVDAAVRPKARQLFAHFVSATSRGTG